jgi:hypothetical protein
MADKKTSGATTAEKKKSGGARKGQGAGAKRQKLTRTNGDVITVVATESKGKTFVRAIFTKHSAVAVEGEKAPKESGAGQTFEGADAKKEADAYFDKVVAALKEKGWKTKSTARMKGQDFSFEDLPSAE